MWRQVEGLIPPATVSFRWNPSNADPPVWETINPKAEPARSAMYSALRKRATEDRDLYKKRGLREYVDALESFVANKMHLSDAADPGRVALWACAHVHHDVEPLAPDNVGKSFPAVVGGIPIEELEKRRAERAQRPGRISRRITLEVSLRNGIVEIESDNLLRTRAVYPPDGEYRRFDDWEEFRRLARSGVDNEIESMRREWRDCHPRQRPSTRDNRDATLDALFAYLFLREPRPNMSTRDGKVQDQRLRDLARLLEITYPIG